MEDLRENKTVAMAVSAMEQGGNKMEETKAKKMEQVAAKMEQMAADTREAAALGKEQMEGLLGFQRDLVVSCEQASRAWFDRVKSEVDSWTQLTSKVSNSRSPAEIAGAYQEWIGAHLRMTIDDGERLSNHCQHFIQKMTRPFGNGRPTAGF